MDHNLVFIIIQIVGIAILLFEVVYVSLQKPSSLQKVLLILGTSCLLTFIFYLVELQATTVEVAMVGAVLGYVSKPLSVLSILIFLLEYCNIKYNKKIIVGLLLFLTFITVIVFTNQYHGLYYSSVAFDVKRNGSGLILGHGPFWYIYMVTTICFFIAYLIIIIFEYRRTVTKRARQMLVIIGLMFFFGIAGLILFVTGGAGGYDATVAGTFLGSICLLILLVKYRLFDTVTLAKDKFLATAENGFVITNARDKIIFYNDVALNIVPELVNIGKRSIKDKNVIDIIDKMSKEEAIFVGDKVYLLKVSQAIKKTYFRKRDFNIGTSYTFTDITAQHNYAQTLNEDINIATKKIKDIQRSILISFANLVESRDGYTGTHIKNVSVLCKNLSIELSKLPEYKDVINNEFIEIIEECSPLHDIGKIKVPDAILNKKGKLTPEEFAVIKLHPLEGGKIVNDTLKNVEEDKYVDMCMDLVTCHHEWWNGSGYPYGLKGENIPLSARIMAVCDVYDALRMARSYKKAFSKEESIKIMKEEAGTHFDPKILKVFLDSLDNDKE